MAKYKHGEMSVVAQEETFNGFIRWALRIGFISIAILVFLAIFNS
ncbi:MAG: aa3-type cytochrome c oxidase subunit IV [Proteobacteria bacterium]|nr:aa3-type cytochrome c oxidase subunit IV [Pseudomonadota bacterium]